MSASKAQDDGQTMGTALSAIFTVKPDAPTEAIWHVGKYFGKWLGYGNMDDGIDFIKGFLIGVQGTATPQIHAPKDNEDAQ